MPIWRGRVGACQWAYHNQDYTSEEWKDYVEDLDELRDSRTPIGILTIAYQVRMPNARERQMLAKAAEAVPSSFRHAFVSDSTMTRGVLTALDWLIKKPYGESIFATPGDGLDWLEKELKGIDKAAVLAAIRKAVPLAHQWPEALGVVA